MKWHVQVRRIRNVVITPTLTTARVRKRDYSCDPKWLIQATLVRVESNKRASRENEIATELGEA